MEWQVNVEITADEDWHGNLLGDLTERLGRYADAVRGWGRTYCATVTVADRYVLDAASAGLSIVQEAADKAGLPYGTVTRLDAFTWNEAQPARQPPVRPQLVGVAHSLEATV